MKRWIFALCALLATGAACPSPKPPTPPAPTSFRLQVYVHNAATDGPLLTATVYRDNVVPQETVSVGPDSGAAWVLPPSDFNVCGLAPGYVPTCAPVPLHKDLTIALHLALVPLPPEPPPPGPSVVWPPARARAALPPFPGLTDTQPAGAAVWSPEDYQTSSPFTPPDHQDMDFHRGNVIGVRVPGLTWHGYGTDKDPTLVTTWDQPRRSVEEQALVLEQYANVDGYTHFLISIPQARNAGVLNDAQFLGAAVRAKTYQQKVVVAAFGGDGESWESDVRPWLDKLVALHAVDEIVTCWQCDQHYSPFDLVTLTKQVGEYAHARGLKVSQHWVNDALAWWTPADSTDVNSTCKLWAICDRFSYHKVVAQWVDYQYFQGDTEAGISDFQWALSKVLQSLTTEKLVAAEYDMQAEFDDPLHRLEIGGDEKGYLLSLSNGWGKAMYGGYMNGGRRPDGRVH